MSKIAKAKGRDINKFGESGYTRVIGNTQLGQLLSKVQATVIANGTELEKMIVERCKTIENIDDFIKSVTEGKINSGTYLCTKKILKKTQNYKACIAHIEPDMLIFIVSNQRICKIIEVKDGETFDTKKAAGEKENLIKFSQNFGVKIPFVLQNILTGRELCEILNIDFDDIVRTRTQDSIENFDYFINKLLEIPEVREVIKAKI